MGQFGLGQSVPREEDPRLLRGQGEFIADMTRPRMAYGYVLRSPHAHARIVSLDTRGAAQMPGVLGVFTAADLKADGIGTLKVRMPRKRPDGSPLFQSPHPGLARGATHYVGDPVAYVVAESIAEAKDAAEKIEAAYEPLPAVVLTADAVKPGAPAVWAECPDNVSNAFELGDKAAVDAAFAAAHHVTRQRFVITRIMHNAIEPRGCIGEYDASATATSRSMAASARFHSVRRAFAEDIFKIPENRFRVVSGDIGGAFGSKGNTAPENTLALYAARKVGRPVKWIAERGEALSSDDHCRDNVTDAELALDKDGTFLALRVKTLCQPRRLFERRHEPAADLRPISAHSQASTGRRRSMSACSGSSPTPPPPRPIAGRAGPRRAMSSNRSSITPRSRSASIGRSCAAAT